MLLSFDDDDDDDPAIDGKYSSPSSFEATSGRFCLPRVVPDFFASVSTLISRTLNATNIAMKLATTPDKMIARFDVMTHVDDEDATVATAFASSSVLFENADEAHS